MFRPRATWTLLPLAAISILATAFADGASSECTTKDISISQGMVSRLHGIPVFKVEIAHLCNNPKCITSGVHFNCGEFTSATLIRRSVFRRIATNDCLVNNGAPLRPGAILSFTYATNFMYPLSVSRAHIRCHAAGF